MTACASVADVFALSEDPRSLSLSAIRRALGIGFDRARVVKEIAVREARVRAVMRELGVCDAEARYWLQAQGSEA